MEGKKSKIKNHAFVPVDILMDIKRDQNKILSILKKAPGKSPDLEDYFTEPEAQKFLGRKSTWLYNMRMSGKLPFSKVGNKIYYAKKDIIQLIESHKISE